MNKQNLFKCISNNPIWFKKGDVYNNNDYPGLEKFPDHFAPYKFTTHDGVDLFAGDSCLAYRKGNNGEWFCEGERKFNGLNQHWTYFSTRESAGAWIDSQKLQKTVKPDIAGFLKLAADFINANPDQFKEFINKQK